METSKKEVILMSETKQKISVYLKPETVEQMKRFGKKKGYKTNSEYVEKALEFYYSFETNRQTPEFLSAAMFHSLRSLLEKTEHARSRSLFKLAVEISMLLNVVAAANEFRVADLDALRHSCIEEVQNLNGSIRLDDAIKWQEPN